jgi:2-haloacid dehalogenase
MVPRACCPHGERMSRRDFLRLLSGSAIATLVAPSLLACAVAPAKARPSPSTPPSSSSSSPPPPRARAAAAQLRAVAFDLFTIFDPRSVLPVAEALMPGDGAAFVEAWRTRQFQYSWLRSSAGVYRDFRHITEDAVIYAARARKHTLTPSAIRRLVEANEQLEPWPDAAAALRGMARAGLRLVTLANFTLAMQRELLGRAGLEDVFEQLISTDEIQAYKPEPRAYQLGVSRLALAREQIAFAAFGAWDAAGAAWYGYPTFWVNRLDLPAEELVRPEATGASLTALADWIAARGSSAVALDS